MQQRLERCPGFPFPEIAAFDPARTDPSRLIEVVGEEAAAVIHRFYTGPS